MRPLSSPARFLATTLLLLSSSVPLLSTAHPLERISPIPPLSQSRSERQTIDERGFADFLGGGKGGGGTNIASALGNLTQDLSAVLTDATALLQSFMQVIQELKNATNENDLVNLLGLDVSGAKSDSQKVTNATVGAVGANVTCPGMAVLFARGTLEPGVYCPLFFFFSFLSCLSSGTQGPRSTNVSLLTGNVGLYTGPSFFTALRNYINGSTTLAVQGVPYPASIPGFLVGGSPFGSAVMATLVNRTAAACPNTKIVLSGYSQGAQVVHNAMSLINAPAAAATAATAATAAAGTGTTTTAAAAASTTTAAAGIGTSSTSSSTSTAATQPNAIAGRQATSASASASSTATATATPAAAAAAEAPSQVSVAQVNNQVSSVVLFGDPRNGTAVTGTQAGRVLSLCNAQDDICAKGGDAITLAHLTYNRDAAQAAMFVMQRSGMGLASTDATAQGMGNVPVVPAAQGVSGAMQLGSGPGLPGMAAFLRGIGK